MQPFSFKSHQPHSSEFSAEQVVTFLNEQSLLGRPFIVALSGGLDSMVMLRVMLEVKALVEQPLDLSAIHINHGLSPKAQEWQRFVEQYCDINEVPLTVKVLSLQKNKLQSLEQVARDARYKAIGESSPMGAVVLTGHHQQDQTETFILRLLRGSGLSGLGAMKPVSPLPTKQAKDKRIKLARPLLTVSKLAMQQYANRHFLEWVEDESNESLSFDRNFIRHKIAPVMTERWPHLNESIGKSVQHLQADYALLSHYLNEELEQLVQTVAFGRVGGSPLFEFEGLNLKLLNQLPGQKQLPLLRLFIERQTGTSPSLAAQQQIIESVIGANKDRQPKLTVNGFDIKMFDDVLYAVSTKAIEQRQQTIEANLKVELNNHSAFSLVYNKPKSTIKPHEKSGTKKVSELLKQKRCPAWLRPRVPLLAIEDKVVAVVGFAIDIEYQSHMTLKLT